MRGVVAAVLMITCGCTHTAVRASRPSATTEDDTVIYESRPYARNFLPFGGGQFQNGETAKGVGFAVGQGVTAATSIGLFVYLVGHYRDNQVPLGEGARVRNMERVEILTGYAFFGLYAWSVIDALVHHEPWVQIGPARATLAPTGSCGLGATLTWSQ